MADIDMQKLGGSMKPILHVTPTPSDSINGRRNQEVLLEDADLRVLRPIENQYVGRRCKTHRWTADRKAKDVQTVLREQRVTG